MPKNAHLLRVGLPGTREQSKVAAAREAVESDLEFLEDVPSITMAGLTGSAFTRAASLDAAVRSLLISLPVAVVACFLVAAVFMRSVRYAFVTIIPIGLVVAWLYAIMYLLGFDLNFVTATIGAISIGVGVDFSIHLTQRFREEMSRDGNGMGAIERAAKSTGMALIGSASSSVLGLRDNGICANADVFRLRHSDCGDGIHGRRRCAAGTPFTALAGDATTETVLLEASIGDPSLR